MNPSVLRIRTPEGIVFSQLLAGPVTRFLAWFIDLLCIMALLTTLGQCLHPPANSSALTWRARFTRWAISPSASATASPANGAGAGRRSVRSCSGSAWWTPRAFGCNSTRSSPATCSGSWTPCPSFTFVGGITCWLSPKCQRLGDIAANTIVIRNPRVTQPDLDQLLARQVQLAPPIPAPGSTAASGRFPGRGGRGRAGPACDGRSLTPSPASVCSPTSRHTSAPKPTSPPRPPTALQTNNTSAMWWMCSSAPVTMLIPRPRPHRKT